MIAFRKLGLDVAGNENHGIQRVCAEQGISFEHFLQEMDRIDWEEELPPDQDYRIASDGHK